jgi:hypothetical protein
VLVDTWTVEQRHEENSPYRYFELERNGRGPLSSYTGIIPQAVPARIHLSHTGFEKRIQGRLFAHGVPELPLS